MVLASILKFWWNACWWKEINGGPGACPRKIFETTLLTMLDNGIFCESPFHEITTKFLTDHDARRSLQSQIHRSKISKSRNYALKVAK